MLKQPWKAQRQLTEKSDALYRWDRVYQYLLQISVGEGHLSQKEVEIPLALQLSQEVTNGISPVSESFYTSANPIPDD